MIAATIVRCNKWAGRGAGFPSHWPAIVRRIAENRAHPADRGASHRKSPPVTTLLRRLASPIARAAAAGVAALLLASCGGGGVSANPSPIVDSPTLTILPATAVLYSGLPTTFVLSGGTGAYIVASSNQAVVPVVGGVTGRSVTVLPSPVTVDTSVTLTVRDTGNAAPVSATLTVKPGTVNNDLTVTPSATQDASCSPAICSGADAQVSVTISQGGIPLAARGIRFTAVTGSYTFLPLGSGVVEQAGAAFVTTTDETGTARAKIQVKALASSQTALIQATDLASGAYRQASFPIVQFTGNTPAFFTLPSTITFTGPYTDVCASNAATDVAVYGGTPPYAISGGSSAFGISPATVLANGGRFTVTLFSVPVCLSGGSIGVTDATGRTISVTVNNVAGSGTAPAPGIVLAPSALSLGCGLSGSIVVVNGTPPFNVGFDHPGVTASVGGPLAERTITVTRAPADPVGPPYPGLATISVTDGTSSAVARVSVPTTCP